MLGLWTFYAVMLISFCGLYAGLAIGYIAKDELKPGKKYLQYLHDVVLTFFIGVMLYYFDIPMLITVLLAVPIFVLLQLVKDNNTIKPFVYIVMGVMLFLSETVAFRFFLMTGITIFLYGLPVGSLYLERNIEKKPSLNITDVALLHSIFLVVTVMVKFWGVVLTFT